MLSRTVQSFRTAGMQTENEQNELKITRVGKAAFLNYPSKINWSKHENISAWIFFVKKQIEENYQFAHFAFNN